MNVYELPRTVNIADFYSQGTTPARQLALQRWQPPVGSSGIDIGCGAGTPLMQLLDLVGPDGHITGIDNAAKQLELAETRIASHPLHERVRLIEADATRALPFADGSFDWAWAENSLWPKMLGPDFEVLREIKRVLKPGSTLALFYGNMHRAMMLPAHAHLEHKLYAADAVHWFGHGSSDPNRHFDNAAAWLQRLGFEQIEVSTHLCEYRQPLPPVVRQHLELSLTAYFGPDLKPTALATGMTEDEWATWVRISDPASPEYILDRPDYRLVRMMTLTTGVMPS